MRSFALGVVALSLVCIGCGSSTSPTPQPPTTTTTTTVPPVVTVTVTKVTVTGPTQIAGLNQKIQLAAIATYSDNTTKDVTAECSWGSAFPGVATVDKGTVTSAGVGKSAISASLSGQQGNLTVEVTASPATRVDFFVGGTATVDLGKTLQIAMKGTFQDGTTADVTRDTSLENSNASVVTVGPTGLVTAVSPGTSNITATYQGLHAILRVTVPSTVPPPPPPTPTPSPIPTPPNPPPPPSPGPTIPGGPGTPSIGFTFVPSLGSFSDLRGQVLHVDPSNYKVEVYIKVGLGWWTKPTFPSPLTNIAADGTFVTDVTTGGTDEKATSIVAFLVTSSHTPVTVGGSATVPISVNGIDVIAVASVNR